MRNLYRTDLRRILKDRLFLIAAAIAAGFAVTTPLLNKLLVDLLLGGETEILGVFNIDAKTMFFTSFAPGNNIGLICPIMLGIILGKDFTYGTVRNKIIGGKSRTAIFLSYFLSCATALCLLIFFHALLTLLVSLLFFDYQAAPFAVKDLLYLLLSLAMEVFVYLFISALVAFLCVFVKSTGLSVVLYVAANFLFSIIGGIVSTARMFLPSSQEFLAKILKFLEPANIFSGTYIGMVPSYDTPGVAAVFLTAIGGMALCLLLGIVSFKKKDLK